MKKFSVMFLLSMFVFCGVAQARTVYDSTGRHIVQHSTIRGQKREAAQKAEYTRKMEAAAAAKLDYEQALKALENEEMKSNYYQDKTK